MFLSLLHITVLNQAQCTHQPYSYVKPYTAHIHLHYTTLYALIYIHSIMRAYIPDEDDSPTLGIVLLALLLPNIEPPSPIPPLPVPLLPLI